MTVPICELHQMFGWNIDFEKSETGGAVILIKLQKKIYRIPFGFSFVAQGLNTVLTATQPMGLKVPFEAVQIVGEPYVVFKLNGKLLYVHREQFEDELKQALESGKLPMQPVPDSVA
jgi:hypothetical protein